MLPVASLLLLVVLLSGALLFRDVQRGAVVAASRLRVGLYVFGAAAGASLAIVAVRGEPVLAVAFVPVTLLSLYQASKHAQALKPGWGSTLGTALALGALVVGCLSLLPRELDRHFLKYQVEQVRQISAPPPSIHPDAGRSVRT